MNRADFEKIIAEEFPRAIPEKFRDKIKNVAILIEDEPSKELCKERGLADNMALLGLYNGIPLTLRGDSYGIGMVIPDTITLYQKPIEHAAGSDDIGASRQNDLRDTIPQNRIRIIVRETLWHEVGHYFGLSDEEIEKRQEE